MDKNSNNTTEEKVITLEIGHIYQLKTGLQVRVIYQTTGFNNLYKVVKESSQGIFKKDDIVCIYPIEFKGAEEVKEKRRNFSFFYVQINEFIV